MYKEHWVNIIRYCKKYIWLLIFPLLRGIHSFRDFTFSLKTIRNWLQGSIWDLLILFIIIGYGYIQWYNSKYYFSEKEVIHEYGVIIKNKTVIPNESIVSVIAEEIFYLRPLKALKFYIDTTSGNISQSDIHLIIKKSDYYLIKKTLPIFRRTEDAPPEKRPSLLSTILFSFFFSSSMSGTIYVLAFLFQGGKNIIDFFNELQLQENLNKISSDISSKLRIVPPIIITISVVIAVMWLVSFISNCIKYINFKVIKRNQNMEIKYGLLTKRHYFIDSSRINYTDLRQSLIMKIKCFNFFTATASCPGYGNKSTQIPVFFPFMTKKNIKQTLSLLIPNKNLIENDFKSSIIFFWQFLWQPVIGGLAVLAVCLIGAFALKLLKEFFLFIMIMAEIPIIWLLIVRFVDIYTNGVGIKDGQVVLRYCKGFTFHTILADTSKVVKIKTTQSYYQKKFNVCNMYFYFESRNQKYHKILAIKMSDAKKIESLITK